MELRPADGLIMELRPEEDAPATWESILSAVEDSTSWYRDLVEHSQNLLCVHDLEGRLLSVNPVPARLLGYSVEEMLRRPMRDFLSPQYCAQFETYLEEIKQNGESHGLMAVMTKSGETRIWEYHNTLRTEGSSIPLVRGIAHDVTDRVRAEQTLRATNEQLLRTTSEQRAALRRVTLSRALLDQANDVILVVDPATMRFLDVNEKASTSLGYGRQELLLMTVFDIDVDLNDDSREQVMCQLRDVGSAILERRFRRKDGTTYPVEVNLRRVQLDQEYIVAISRDITVRKAAEERLREFERVVENLEEMIVVINREYRYVIVNRAFLSYRGMTKEEVVGRLVTELLNPDVFETVVKPRMDEAFQGKVVNYELRYRFPAIGERNLAVTYVPVEGPKGIDRVACVLRDVTERRQADEALRQSEERFRVALKHSPIAVFNQDRDLRYTWMYNSQLPWSGSGKLGKNLFELFRPDEAERIAEIRRRVLDTGVGERSETQVTYDGKRFYLDTTIEPLLDSGGSVIGITGASMDVTELRETSEALREAKRKLTEEKLYLEKEIDTELGFGEIVGQSKALQKVMEQVGKVASSDATVLLLGETGTGKELVARAIHRLSQRLHNSFIKMNCAAIPSGLLESELFGHEKGAFTGAVGKKVGRLELADNGTLFLDEIGEIALPLQPKLLRVLQDQEFERLGGNHTLKVNFRLIAATNSDLSGRVRENEFRSDLFYRLNVFPIRVPALRERREDIHLLVEHFVQKCSRRMNKSITSIPTKTMDALMAWEWPGNVRELENFIERSVILTEGSVLMAPLNELQPTGTKISSDQIFSDPTFLDQTLESVERECIMRALLESNGQVGGPSGAAKRLGLKRTTLQSKMKQLGIKPRSTHPTH
jgi:PAS domain S-box-containing protein